MSGYLSRAVSLTTPWLIRRTLSLNLNQPQFMQNVFRMFNSTAKHHSGKIKPLTSTSVMMQDGAVILEMPCIVQIINGDFEITSNGQTKCRENIGQKSFKKLDFEEESEMILGFVRCNSIKEVFTLLNVCPEEEVIPSVALAVLRRLFELENSREYRSQGSNIFQEESNFTFTRSALIKRLVETVCASSDPQIIVEAVRSIGNDPNKGDKYNYLEELCTESIILATDGKLSINQLCEVIKAFHNLGEIGKDYIDKVWIGFNVTHGEINEEELCNLMSILPLVKNSRTYLYNLVEKKIPLVWQKLKPEHIIRLVHILVQLKISSRRLLSLISRWTNLNIHILTEGNLRWIVYSFMSLEYTDDNIQRALSRYLKAKKSNIRDCSLVTVILDYCRKMQIRHPNIFNSVSEYYVYHGKKLSVTQIPSFVNSFGFLNFIPVNSFNFFQTLEFQVQNLFSQFSQDDLLDMFLSCIYLQRYPLNFVKHIFSSYFFDQLYSLPEQDFNISREKLNLIDLALTIEAPTYNGPLLLKHGLPRSLYSDARIKRCLDKIQCTLIDIIGNSDRISYSCIVPLFSSSSWYVVDCVVDMTGKVNPCQPHSEPNNKKFALLIHLPEHFDTTERHLIGPQVMKIRHIKYAGLKVVSLNYNILNKLIMYPSKLKEYIEEEMSRAFLEKK